MIIGETVKVALSSIRANKLRAALTMLGIVIGVGAVIAVVALGSGAQKAVEDRINALGANVLTVYPGQSFFGGRSSDVRVSLTVDDADALREDAHLISDVVPELSRSMTVGYSNQNLNVNIVGTTPNFLPVKNFTILYGQMFTTGDDGARQRYAVLGSSVPEMLDVNPAALLKQLISIGGQTFEVIGVLAKKGAAMSWQNPDEQILIPLNTARFRLMGTDRIRQVSLKVKEDVPLEQGMVDIERILRREHKIRPGGDNDFQIRNQQEILATQQQATEVFGVLLASIAAVSLVVGGIGIMNIMLVSVTERTREIGVRRALGATRLNIMSQFLIEAVVLCLMGGAFGVLVGAGSARVMSKLLGWNTLISPTAVIVAFAFSAFVGLFFGLWPARRAANLNTIDALRYE
ncbi:MAG: FtsX-like permease family protein [Gemmatimonadetes bacterium]|nr:FtsX-like permease family protein [Gemmatimonadota bacterium]